MMIPHLGRVVRAEKHLRVHEGKSLVGVRGVRGGVQVRERRGMKDDRWGRVWSVYGETLVSHLKPKEAHGGSRVDGDKSERAFPGGLVVSTLRFHCRGHGFDPWLGELRSCKPCSTAKK